MGNISRQPSKNARLKRALGNELEEFIVPPKECLLQARLAGKGILVQGK